MDIGEIYKITGPDGKVYIGQSVCQLSNGTKYGTHGLWVNHLSDARKSNGGNCRKLNYAIKKFGEQAFYVQPLISTNTSMLDYYESRFIKEFKSNESEYGYNLRSGGNHSRLSLETRKIMSDQRRINPCFQQPHSAQTKAKISNALIEQTIRKNGDGSFLPKYVKYIKWKDRHGYAIVSHPKCKIKYFVSKSYSLPQLLEKCIEYLTTL
jgi:hypothetical protein